MQRVAAILFCLGMPGCVIIQLGATNPVPGLSTVAVAPFFNLSQEKAVDGRRFASAYFAELQKTPGFEVVPIGVTEQAIYDNELEMTDPQDVLALARILGVDAVVVGAVTDYDPYYPPRIGLKVAWYSTRHWKFVPNILAGVSEYEFVTNEGDVSRDGSPPKCRQGRISIRGQSMDEDGTYVPDVPRLVKGWRPSSHHSQPSHQAVVEPFASEPLAASVANVRIDKATSTVEESEILEDWQPFLSLDPLDGEPAPAPEISSPIQLGADGEYSRDEESHQTAGSLNSAQIGVVSSAQGGHDAVESSDETTAPHPEMDSLPHESYDGVLEESDSWAEASFWQDGDVLPEPAPTSTPEFHEVDAFGEEPAPSFAEDASPQWDPRSPLMSYARIFDGSDANLVSRLRDYVELSGDRRSGGWEAYLHRSEDFIRFTAHVMIVEMLTLHGGEGRRRFVFKIRNRD